MGNDKIAEMQDAGASDKECRDLTEKTKKDIETVVTNNQKIIDSLTTGQECHSEGQTEVKVATESLSKAKTTLQITTTELTKAESTQVDFGSRTFSSLKKGECATFFTHSSYTTAKAKHTAAVTAKTKAIGAHTEAQRILKVAISTAAKMKHTCQCKVQTLHRKEYTERSAANAANKKAWDLAHQILCVLDHKTSCKWKGVPVLTKATIDTAAKDAKCNVAT